MGNCFVLCKPNKSSNTGEAADKHGKVLQVVKTDGKILEFRAPITVKDLLVKSPGFGVAVSERVSHHLPPTYELKIGNIYYLLPSPSSAGVIGPSHVSSPVETEQASGIKRIKVVITKQQLQELLSKEISVEDVLSGLERRTCSSTDSPSTCWKPKLEPIPEGTE